MKAFAGATEDRPTPPEVYNWKVYTSACIISMGVLSFGYDTSFIGTTITQPSFKRDFGLDHMSKHELDEITGNITSFYSVGGFFGALVMFFSLELLGRKIALLLSSVVFIAGAIISTATNGSVGLMYAGRILSGLGMGGCVAVTPTYISELSPPAIRGRMTGFFETLYQAGSLIGFWINYGIKQNMNTDQSVAWRIPMAVQLIPTCVVVLCIPMLKESPTWLLKRGRDDEALLAYSYIHNLPASHHYILEEVGFIREQIEIERGLAVDENRRSTLFGYISGAMKEAASRGVRNRFALVAMMCLLQPWCGAVAINYYSPTIFTSIGLTNTTLWTGIYGLIKSVASIFYFSLFIDMAGRKWPWIISCVCCAVCQYYLAAYIAIAYPTSGANQTHADAAAGKGATAAIMLFGFTWSFGANGLPLLIASEVFPPSLRSVGGPFASLNVWLWSFVVTKSLPSMFTSMGYGIYVFFGTILIVAAIYGFFYIPETKGLRIDQMDLLFGGVGGKMITCDEEAAKKSVEVVHEETVPESTQIS